VAGDSCPLPVLLRSAPEPGFPPAPKAKKTAGLTQVAPRDGHSVIKYLEMALFAARSQSREIHRNVAAPDQLRPLDSEPLRVYKG
jgi:hypothetical protein